MILVERICVAERMGHRGTIGSLQQSEPAAAVSNQQLGASQPGYECFVPLFTANLIAVQALVKYKDEVNSLEKGRA